jgi:hypothetical protein
VGGVDPNNDDGGQHRTARQGAADRARECALALRLPQGLRPSGGGKYARWDGCRAMARWRLDHILYTLSMLAPLARWAMLEDNKRLCLVGLPNDRIPTNHLQISALFEMRGHP